MNENIEESVLDVSLASEVNETGFSCEEVLEVLAKTEIVDKSLEKGIHDKYWYGFYKKLCSKLSSLPEDFFEKGETAIGWAEVKGLPLPTSKLGMQVWSGLMGTAGVAVPGLGVLLPIAYILWKRSQSVGGVDDEIKQEYV